MFKSEIKSAFEEHTWNSADLTSPVHNNCTNDHCLAILSQKKREVAPESNYHDNENFSQWALEWNAEV